MKTFNPIHREYVAPVDLSVLQNTYNTLEQGHKDAIIASSELKKQLALLDLNNAEDEWRARKVNEVQSILQENTLHGNSYAALDDMIAASSDILFSADTMGRIKANQAWKANNAKIDAMNIPENYKQMYKELNPYHYEDKYDNNGNIIGGTEWKPNSEPVNTVPLSEIIKNGISIAARESGGGNVTRFLTASGQVTTDPSQAWDGEVYNSATNKWEKLGRDKILKGIKAFIETTPGAKASLEQDWKVSKWEHNKAVKANNGKPVVDDFTDDNGNTLSQEDYLMKRIMPAVEAAEYFNYQNSVSYGNGLKTYRAAQAAQRSSASGVNTSAYRQTQNNIIGNNEIMEYKNTYTPTNVISDLNSAKASLQDTYFKVTGRKLYIDSNLNKINIDNLISKNNIDDSNAALLKNYVAAYNSALSAEQAYYNKLNDNDKKEYDFVKRLDNASGYIPSVRGGSKYDDRIIHATNNIFGQNAESVVYSMDDAIMKYFINISGGRQSLINMGIELNENDNTIKVIKGKNNNVLPLIAANLEEAYSRANSGGIWEVFGLGHYYTSKRYDRHGNPINEGAMSGVTSLNTSRTNKYTEELAKAYKRGLEVKNDISNKNNIKVDNVYLNNINYNGKSFTEMSIQQQLEDGFLKASEANAMKDYWNESFKNAIILGGDYLQADIWQLNDKDNIKRMVDKNEDKINIGEEIRAAYADDPKRVIWSPTQIANPRNIKEPTYAYNITILAKTNSDGKPIGNKKDKTYTISNIGVEEAAEMLMSDQRIRNNHLVNVMAATKGTTNIATSSDLKSTGMVSITGINDNVVSADIFDKQFNLNKDVATTLVTVIESHKEHIKHYTGSEEDKVILFGHINVLSSILGIPEKYIYDKLTKDI